MSQSRILECRFNQCIREAEQLFNEIKKAVDKGIEYGKEDLELLQKTVKFITEIGRLMEKFGDDLIEKCDEEIKSLECFDEIIKLLKK